LGAAAAEQRAETPEGPRRGTMNTEARNRWKQAAWYVAVAVAVLVVWRLAVRLFEVARRRWSAGRSR